jgi:hypothetical protein
MDILGGSPEVRSLPDYHSVHLYSLFYSLFSKGVLIVQCNNPRFALPFRNRLFRNWLEPKPAKSDTFVCVFGGGDDQRGRTRVAGATGALAAGASRPRRRDLRIAALAGF